MRSRPAWDHVQQGDPDLGMKQRVAHARRGVVGVQNAAAQRDPAWTHGDDRMAESVISVIAGHAGRSLCR